MIPVFITVRTASTRLHNKCLLPLGDCKVIEHLIRRCLHAEFRTIVCTTTDTTDDILEHIADVEGVEVFRGNHDPQVRWMECADWFDIWSFHALDCDDPYFDPGEVERSYSYLKDMNLHCVMPTQSSSINALGMMGTSISRRTGETKALPENGNFPYFRMTLDYEEDYWFLATLANNGCKPEMSRASVDITASTFSLWQINLFRNKDWRDNQCREIHSENTTVMS